MGKELGKPSQGSSPSPVATLQLPTSTVPPPAFPKATAHLTHLVRPVGSTPATAGGLDRPRAWERAMAGAQGQAGPEGLLSSPADS